MIREILRTTGHYLKGSVLKIDSFLQFVNTGSPEMDAQGGSATVKVKTGEVDAWKFRDDVKGQDIFTIDTLNDVLIPNYPIQGTINLTDYVVVQSKSDLPTPSAGVITLADNTAYQINGTIALGTDHIKPGVSNVVFGLDKSNDGFSYSGTNACITSTNQDVTIRNLFIVANGGSSSALDLSGDNTNNCEVLDIIFNSCDSIGTMSGGFSVFVFRQNLLINNAGGFTISGSSDDMFLTDNLFKGFTGTPTFVTIGTGNYHTILISRNMFEADTGQTALNIATITFAGGGSILSNSFEDAGAYLTGIDANSTGWNIPPRSNVGVAGLLVVTPTIVISAWTTTSGTFLDVPETMSLNSITNLNPNSTIIKARVVVSCSHDQSGEQIEYQLYNKTDSVVVSGSITLATITTAGVYQVEESAEVTLLENKEYRIQFRRATGTGGNAAQIRSGLVEAKIF